METEGGKQMASNISQNGAENNEPLTETERRAAEEKTLIEEAERRARTYIDEKGRSFVDGVYIDENGRKIIDVSHLSFFKAQKESFKEGLKGNSVEYNREAFLERREQEIKKLRRQQLRRQQERICVQQEDGITGDCLFEAFGIDKASLSEARRQDLESIAKEYSNPATRDKARSLFVKMIHGYSRIDKLVEGSGKRTENTLKQGVDMKGTDEVINLEGGKGDATITDNDTENDSDKEKESIKEFDWENWQEPENVNLNSDVRTFWERVKEEAEMIDLYGGIHLELNQIVVSPFSVVLALECKYDEIAATGRPVLLSRLKEIVDDIDENAAHILEALPQSTNIGIGLRRSWDDDAVPSLTEMVNSDAYKRLEKDTNAVPIVLGINHMNEPLVANLANSDNMVIVGSDTYDQSYTAEVVVKGLMFGRSPYDLQLTVLDGRNGAQSIVGHYADLPYSKNSLSSPPTNRNLISWCERAISIFDEVERDCAMRRKIIWESGNCEYYDIDSYNQGTGRNMAHRVVMMANFPVPFHAPDKVKEAVEHLKERVRNFIELDKADVGVHFILWDFGTFWDNCDTDMSFADTLLTAKKKTQFVAYTRFDELGSLLNFAGGKEAYDANNLGPLVYRSPEGEIHYFQFAKVKDDERKLAIDKWGLTRTAVNDNIPDDECVKDERETAEGDDDFELNSGHEEETVDVIAEPSGECVQEETPTLVLAPPDFNEYLK